MQERVIGGGLALLLGLDRSDILDPSARVAFEHAPFAEVFDQDGKRLSGGDRKVPFLERWTARTGREGAPTALVFRDSFTTEMSPFRNASFRQVAYLHHGAAKGMVREVERHSPDIVLCILVERALRRPDKGPAELGQSEHTPRPGMRQSPGPEAPRHMKLDRSFYSISAVVFVLVTFWGFHSFYLHGKAAGGNAIAPEMFALDAIHGAAMTAWLLLFLVQAVLIDVRKRRLHMQLGWAALAVAPVLAASGVLTALRSVQSAPDFIFFEMPYPRFLLVMFTEIALYSAFVGVGLITRRRPAIHRPMMLLASLSILAGSTTRIPALYPVFSQAGWPGLFGPVFALGAVLLVIRFFLARELDRPFAIGYTAMVAVYILATQLAFTEAWSRFATDMLRL